MSTPNTYRMYDTEYRDEHLVAEMAKVRLLEQLVAAQLDQLDEMRTIARALENR